MAIWQNNSSSFTSKAQEIHKHGFFARFAVIRQKFKQLVTCITSVPLLRPCISCTSSYCSSQLSKSIHDFILPTAHIVPFSTIKSSHQGKSCLVSTHMIFSTCSVSPSIGSSWLAHLLKILLLFSSCRPCAGKTPGPV